MAPRAARTLRAMAAAAAPPARSHAPWWASLVCFTPTAALDGLGDEVAFSSRRIAARRALETEVPNSLAVDPLARALAGKRALAIARATAAKPRLGAVRPPVDRIAVRTRWFDDNVIMALRGDLMAVRVSLRAAGDGIELALAPAQPLDATPPASVILAGAGMDARAWRLPLPPGTAWVEVDGEAVLRVKQRDLAAARAATAAASTGQPRFPLKASSIAFVAADLAAPGWAAAAREALPPAARGQPTVVVAEGLLMYLGPAGAPAFLKEAASFSPPGSVLLAVSVTAATAAAARERARGSGLMAAWTFGCDPDPRPLFLDAGWRVVGVDTRSEMARSLPAGYEFEFPVRPLAAPRPARESLFIVAVRE